MSVGSVAALLAQVPAGAICDATMAKRGLAAAGIVVTIAALVLVGTMPSTVAVTVAEAMQGVGGVVLSLSIAAITLGLARHDRLGERLGNNVRFAAIGGALGAGVLGLIGNRVSHMAVFVSAAALGLPALVALWRIHPAAIARAPPLTGHRAAIPAAIRGPMRPVLQVLTDRRLLVLMACVTLFHLANAAMLPLAAGSLARQHGMIADLVVGSAIVIPQLLTAAGSPWVGRLAQDLGRQKILLIGFAMLPLRALLFAIDGTPALALAAQVLDGVTGATFGVLVPLVVADITHDGGRFNLALGMVGARHRCRRYGQQLCRRQCRRPHGCAGGLPLPRRGRAVGHVVRRARPAGDDAHAYDTPNGPVGTGANLGTKAIMHRNPNWHAAIGHPRRRDRVSGQGGRPCTAAIQRDRASGRSRVAVGATTHPANGGPLIDVNHFRMQADPRPAALAARQPSTIFVHR